MPGSAGILLNHLPAIYHSSEDLREFLAVFEVFLFGGEGRHGRGGTPGEVVPLAERIASISSLFDAAETPKEFLPWLSGWVALTDAGGLPEERQRRLLAEIVPLYAKRGTLEYLEKLLLFHAPEDTEVTIDDRGTGGFRIGESKVGVDSRLESEEPFRFKVALRLPSPSRERDRWESSLRRVIDLAKPAHTLYELDLRFEDD